MNVPLFITQPMMIIIIAFMCSDYMNECTFIHHLTHADHHHAVFYNINTDDHHHNTSSSEKDLKNRRHHLHSSVDSYHKLAPTSGAFATTDRSRAAELRRTRNSWNKSPTTPRRIQMDMTTSGDILEASMRQIDSLEQQLQKSEDNRRRQYESMMRQMQTNAEQIIILKKKLQMSHEECSDYKQQYVLKDRELQVTIVHLEAAQSEIKQLKHQLSKVL